MQQNVFKLLFFNFFIVSVNQLLLVNRLSEAFAMSQVSWTPSQGWLVWHISHKPHGLLDWRLEAKCDVVVHFRCH